MAADAVEALAAVAAHVEVAAAWSASTLVPEVALADAMSTANLIAAFSSAKYEAELRAAGDECPLVRWLVTEACFADAGHIHAALVPLAIAAAAAPAAAAAAAAEAAAGACA